MMMSYISFFWGSSGSTATLFGDRCVLSYSPKVSWWSSLVVWVISDDLISLPFVSYSWIFVSCSRCDVIYSHNVTYSRDWTCYAWWCWMFGSDFDCGYRSSKTWHFDWLAVTHSNSRQVLCFCLFCAAVSLIYPANWEVNWWFYHSPSDNWCCWSLLGCQSMPRLIPYFWASCWPPNYKTELYAWD